MTARRTDTLAFFALAYALSWLGWLPLVLASWGWLDGAWRYWHLVGSLGPALAALILARRPGERRQLLARCVRASPSWIAFALGVPLLVFALGAGALALAGVAIDPWRIGQSVEYPALGVPAYVLANLVFYGFGEEIGWRGFALPRIASVVGTPRAAALVAIGWALWHLPLFAFSTGMSQMGPAAIAGWLASIASGSLLMSWLYERSGSVLAPALFHAALDVLIMSPTGGPLQSVMGAAITLLGFALPAITAARSTRPAAR